MKASVDVTGIAEDSLLSITGPSALSGTTVQLKAMRRHDVHSPQDVTHTVTWSSRDISLAVSAGNGKFTRGELAADGGEVTIEAFDQQGGASFTVTVDPRSAEQ